jgi:hypothetical protein
VSKDKAAWGVQILAALAASFFALGMGVAALFSLLNEGEPTRYRLLFPLAGLAVLAAVLLLVECFMRLRAAVRLCWWTLWRTSSLPNSGPHDESQQPLRSSVIGPTRRSATNVHMQKVPLHSRLPGSDDVFAASRGSWICEGAAEYLPTGLTQINRLTRVLLSS